VFSATFIFDQAVSLSRLFPGHYTVLSLQLTQLLIPNLGISPNFFHYFLGFTIRYIIV